MLILVKYGMLNPSIVFLIAEAIKTLFLLRLTSFVAELNALFFILIKPITFF